MKRFLTLSVLAMLCMLLAAPGVAMAKKKIKAGFALLWTIDDRGWTTAHYNGIQFMKDKLGDDVEIIYKEKVLGPDAERVFREFAEEGCDIIFGTTFDHMEPLLRVAKDYPEIKFEHCSGYKTAPNMRTYMVRIYQADYLCGYLAGLMGFKNVGTVGTHPIPEPVRGVNAFTLGLQRGLKEAGVSHGDTVNTVAWLNSWADPVKETTLAETLVAKGHDLIRQMADTPDSSLAACSAGVPAMGYGTNAASWGAECALSSALLNWGPYYVKAIEDVQNGTWKTGSYWKGFEADGVRLAEFKDSVPQDVREKVMTAMQELKDGNDTIFTGPIFDQSGKEVLPEGKKFDDGQLLSMQMLVKGVKGKLAK
ncbi:BMP family ABC transporter substrate-binding protein [Salidesulfovibrio brasiliensis]